MNNWSAKIRFFFKKKLLLAIGTDPPYVRNFCGTSFEEVGFLAKVTNMDNHRLPPGHF
ncbi:hypothetical protein CHY_0198 [Carboxydothermus hydrogenoformans Z-2901]|uniref:Uncharacterized protein n=1 Tax=Carboxydothermus hydrogenoformans (strain ATCC BAA-161 / DSM 6008 / Z-2901) TaxID=246194 RepID=Q3AFL4_CARHZ|nr:hypothetical protein CHY_0198 [Carboxydothermus hydrogenoformans Z-2901]